MARRVFYVSELMRPKPDPGVAGMFRRGPRWCST